MSMYDEIEETQGFLEWTVIIALMITLVVCSPFIVAYLRARRC